MKKINKRAIAAQTLGELIILIAGGILIIFIILMLLGGVSQTVGSFGCGLNVRIYGTFVESFKGYITPPIFLCNQYMEPVKINAADWDKCSGIAEFCKKSDIPTDVLIECYRQCARIQVDALTDACWSMGGSGKLHLWNVGMRIAEFGNKINEFAEGLAKVYFLTFSFVAYPVLTPFIWNQLELGTSINANLKNLNYNEAVLRCFRFQIINPISYPNGTTINYYDVSFGRSWMYALNKSNQNALCMRYASQKNKNCSYGGGGVRYIDEATSGLADYEIYGTEIHEPNDSEELLKNYATLLNYNASPRQVCYISYLNDGRSDAKFVVRNCYGWGLGYGNTYYLN